MGVKLLVLVILLHAFSQTVKLVKLPKRTVLKSLSSRRIHHDLQGPTGIGAVHAEYALHRPAVKILFLRHGSTEWNLDPLYAFLKKHEGLSPGEDIFLHRYTDNKTRIDSFLAPSGIIQAKQAGRLIEQKYPNIKYVFTSPLSRAVQTGLLSTQGLRSEPDYFVNPWLREGISGTTGLGWNCLKYLKKYPFIHGVDRIRDSLLWFLDFWDSVHDTANYKGQLLECCQAQPTSKNILSFLQKNNIQKLENPQQVQTRAIRGLEEIREFIVKKFEKEGIEVQDNQVLVIGHRRIFKPLFQGSEGVETEHDMKNGELVEYDLRLD